MKKNSGASSSRVLGSIPNNVRKTIEHIKEITGGNHNDDDIYAMLKECSMDPNETTQRLLFLDTFHEVKRKRDKKKEALKSKSGEEYRWKSGHQGRGTRTSRGNYSSNDAGGWRSAAIRKDNGLEESREKFLRHSHTLLSKEMDSIQLHGREKLSPTITNGPLELPNGSLSGSHGGELSEEKVHESAENASSIVPKVSEESAPSASDPVLVPPCDSSVSEFVKDNNLNKHEVESVNGSQLSSLASKKQLLEVVEVSHPKISDECSVDDRSHGVNSITAVRPSSSLGVRDASAKLEKMKFSDGQHVIIPQHIQVPDAVKNGLSFGSLDACFGGRDNSVKAESIETSNYVVNSAHEETVSNFNSCDQDDVSTASKQENHSDNPQSSLELPDQNSGVDTKVSSSANVLKDGQAKQENLPVVGPPFPVVQTSPSYTLGFMPPMLANVLAQSEGVESQARAVSSLGETSGSTSTSTPPPTSAFGQPIHVFRQHYPPNYIPYGHYISPFYVPPTMHQYFGHTAFPQPLPTGNMYLPPPTTAQGMKISPPNFKPPTHPGNQTPLGVGVPSFYGAYSTTPSGYVQNGTVTSANSSNAEDLGTPSLKETSIYHGQQSEGSAAWGPTAGGRESAASYPVNSFLNVGPHGQQHMLNPQSGHGGFAFYHTLQPMATPPPALPLLRQSHSQPVTASLDSVGPPSNSYQQPQIQQPINWSI